MFMGFMLAQSPGCSLHFHPDICVCESVCVCVCVRDYTFVSSAANPLIQAAAVQAWRDVITLSHAFKVKLV